MYRNGLNFPIFYIFLNDNIIINSLGDVINQKNVFLVTSEEETNNSIIEFINDSKGYEIYPFLLNHFGYFIQTDLKFNKDIITSKFIFKEEFIFLIRSFKVDFLKIDGSFVKTMAEDPVSLVIVEAIRDISQAMGLQTIAEFVENRKSLDVLREIGVDYAQGYLIHRPEPLEDLVASLLPGLFAP